MGRRTDGRLAITGRLNFSKELQQETLYSSLRKCRKCMQCDAAEQLGDDENNLRTTFTPIWQAVIYILNSARYLRHEDR